jgi:hypothetical protein
MVGQKREVAGSLDKRNWGRNWGQIPIVLTAKPPSGGFVFQRLVIARIILDMNVSHLIQLGMKTIYTTEVFDGWFDSLRDKQAARRIQARIDRAEEGNLGDYKSSQAKDIQTAQDLARQLKE